METRPRVGTQSVHKLRRLGRIPGVLYGHGDPLPVSLDALAFRTAVTPNHYGALMVQVMLDGEPAGAALVKSVQLNTVSKSIMNVDLQRVTAADRVVVSVPIVLTGESPASRQGGVLEQFTHSLSVRCRADAMPQQIVYDITSLTMDESVHAAQLELPPDCELLDKPDETIIKMAPPITHGESTPGTEAGATSPEVSGGKQKESNEG